MNDVTRWTLLLHVGATLAMVGLIWFVQVVHYPLLSRVGRERFRRYELDHQRLVTWVVAPLMATEMLTAILLVWNKPMGVGYISIWLGLMLLAFIWVMTYTVQVPQHAALVFNYDSEVQRRLVRGNWYRTIAWSARGVLALWMVGQALSVMNAGAGTEFVNYVAP